MKSLVFVKCMALNKIDPCRPTIDMIQSDQTTNYVDMIYKNEIYTEKKSVNFFFR